MDISGTASGRQMLIVSCGAQIKVRLLASGHFDLAMRCMVDVIKKCHPWVTAAIKVEMVRQGHTKVCARACPCK